MRHSVGIDVGATSCAAAACWGASLEPCELSEGELTMPAVALPRHDGTVVVGEEADRLSTYEPSLVGRMVTTGLFDPEPVMVDGVPCHPLPLTEALLDDVLERARQGEEAPPEHVIVAYPLRPDGGPERLLAEAAHRATGGTAVLVPAPIAAAAKLARDRDLGPDALVAVVDFGGTSVDVTLVRCTPEVFDLVGDPVSLTDVGGVDLDAAVVTLTESAIGDVTSMVAPSDRVGMLALRRLRASCRAAKERLATDEAAIVDVALPHARAQVEITRGAFEDAVAPMLHAAAGLVLSAIDDAGLIPADLHTLLLVGGSSRIPSFTRLVSERTGMPVTVDDEPELTVALGAALFGEVADQLPGIAHVPTPAPVRAGMPPPIPAPGGFDAGARGPDEPYADAPFGDDGAGTHAAGPFDEPTGTHAAGPFGAHAGVPYADEPTDLHQPGDRYGDQRRGAHYAGEHEGDEPFTADESGGHHAGPGAGASVFGGPAIVGPPPLGPPPLGPPRLVPPPPGPPAPGASPPDPLPIDNPFVGGRSTMDDPTDPGADRYGPPPPRRQGPPDPVLDSPFLAGLPTMDDPPPAPPRHDLPLAPPAPPAPDPLGADPLGAGPMPPPAPPAPDPLGADLLGAGPLPPSRPPARDMPPPAPLAAPPPARRSQLGSGRPMPVPPLRTGEVWPAALDAGWYEDGGSSTDDGWPQSDGRWDDARTSVFDTPPPPTPPDGEDWGQPPAEEFRRLTTSDTDPFGSRSGSLASRRRDREGEGEDDWDDEDDDDRRGLDLRLVAAGAVAAIFLVVLAGLAVLSGGGDSDPIAVADTVPTTAPPTTSGTAALTAASSTTTSSTTTTTEPEEEDDPPDTGPPATSPPPVITQPPPPPPPTTTTTRPRPTTTSTTSTTSTSTTTSTTTLPPS